MSVSAQSILERAAAAVRGKMISAITFLLALLLGLASCQGTMGPPGATSEAVSGLAPNASVSGTITYRERIALTPDATVVVELRDVSLADAAAPLVASQTIHDPGQVPIAFTVPYNRDVIDPRNTYAISARIIESDGRLAFINDTAYEVITRGNPNRADMLLVLVQPPPQLLRDQVEGQEPDNGWRTWVEVPASVISANLLPDEAELFLRVVYLQSTIEGCARPGEASGSLDGNDIVVRLTLMQPPETPWAIPCEEEMVELDEVLPVREPLKPGPTYRVVVNHRVISTFNLPDPGLGHTVLAQSAIQSAEMVEPKGDTAPYQVRVVSGRPSGSCTRYNGNEIRLSQQRVIDVAVTHHRVADPQARCTKDFPIDETLVPLDLDLESGAGYTVTVNGNTRVSFTAR